MNADLERLRIATEKLKTANDRLKAYLKEREYAKKVLSAARTFESTRVYEQE